MSTREKQSRRSAVDVDVVKAIGHPLRMQLLSRLNERVASPVEMARELDESVQLVSYHVRILRDLGFVELVKTTPRRGAIEHHYRAIRRPYFSDADSAALPANARATIAGGVLEDIVQHAAHAHKEGVFEKHSDINLMNVDLVLDDESWTKLKDRLNELYTSALDLQAEAIPRIQGGAESFTARLVTMGYPAAEGSPPATATTENKGKSRKKKR